MPFLKIQTRPANLRSKR